MGLEYTKRGIASTGAAANVRGNVLARAIPQPYAVRLVVLPGRPQITQEVS